MEFFRGKVFKSTRQIRQCVTNVAAIGSHEGPRLIVSTHMDDLQVAEGNEAAQDLFQHLREQGPRTSSTRKLFPNGNSFGVFSHSKGSGAELFSGSLCFSGADPSWTRVPARCTKVPFHQGFTKVPPRFHQGCNQVSPRFHHGCALVFCGRSVLLLKGSVLKGSVEGFTEIPPRFHQGHARFVISLVFWGRSVLGRQKVLWKVPPSLL